MNHETPSTFAKVIAYMTLGIDVSRLFTEMMLAIETRDLVVKKMVYLYLCTYARQKPDLAIMCINTLQRDWCVAGSSFQLFSHFLVMSFVCFVFTVVV